MKEEEAKTKWCPMARTGMMFATNRSENGCINKEDMCIASACMLWKWFDSNMTQGRCGLCVGGDS